MDKMRSSLCRLLHSTIFLKYENYITEKNIFPYFSACHFYCDFFLHIFHTESEKPNAEQLYGERKDSGL
jgi:hypothetical protein